MPKMKIEQKQSKLLQIFAKLQMEFKQYSHQALFTVAQSKQSRGNIDGGHCKNLLLKDRNNLILMLVCLEDAKFNLKTIHNIMPSELNCRRFSMLSPNLMQDTLGIFPGSVSPFAIINDNQNKVKVILEKNMLKQDKLNFHPLINTETITIKTPDLLKFIDYCGNEYYEVDYAE